MGESTKHRGKSNLTREPAIADRTRRRLLQGGLAATPLLTLVSRPVLGSVQCVRGSAFDSIPASGQGREQFCSGSSPGYWKQPHHFADWPAPYVPGSLPQSEESGEEKGKGQPKGAVLVRVFADNANSSVNATRFNSVFSPSPYPDSVTLLDALEMGGGPPNDVARHIVAALLNAAAGLTPVLKVHEVQNIWHEYVTSGYFEPTAGIKWYHEEIVDYLESTMSQ
jgi:hypothetical protein